MIHYQLVKKEKSVKVKDLYLSIRFKKRGEKVKVKKGDKMAVITIAIATYPTLSLMIHYPSVQKWKKVRILKLNCHRTS